MKIKKILTFSIFLLSALFVSNQINASEGINLRIVQDEYAGAINPTLYINSSDNEIYTDEQGSYFVIKDGDQKEGLGDFYLSDYPELFGEGIYKIQFHNVTNYESTGVFYEVANVSHITVSGQYEKYIFKIYNNNSQLIGTQELYEGSYKIDFVTTKDNVYPVINGKTNYITNVNNPTTEANIRAGLYAYDNIDGDISSSFVLVSDEYTTNKNILGTYDIVYKVSDSAGNESQVTVKVHVVDATKPVISGQNTYTIVYNQTQSLTAVLNSLTVTDNYQSGIIPVLVEDNYTANKAVKGSYTVKYKATDNSGNESDLFVVTINVVDTIKPVITGTSSYTHVYNNKLELSTIKAALTATDGYDGNITANITLKSDNYTANYNKKGSYQVVYTVKDSSNNSIDYTVTINVIDNIKPIISGQAIYNTGSQVQLSEATIRAALTAVDDYDGSLVVNLLSDGYSSNYTIIGSHTIVYKVTDASGNVTEYAVTINVFDDVPPVIYTNDAFINIDGTLNYTLQQIIDHLIRVGDLQASVNFDNYYVSTSDYDPSTPGQYEVVLMRSDLAPESLKERVSVGIRVLEPNPIPTNPVPTPDDSSTPVNIWPYLVGTFIAGIFIIAFINRKKR